MGVGKSSPEDTERLNKITDQVMRALEGEDSNDGFSVLSKIIAALVIEHYNKKDHKSILYDFIDMTNKNYKIEKKKAAKKEVGWCGS